MSVFVFYVNACGRETNDDLMTAESMLVNMFMGFFLCVLVVTGN